MREEKRQRISIFSTVVPKSFKAKCRVLRRKRSLKEILADMRKNRVELKLINIQ